MSRRLPQFLTTALVPMLIGAASFGVTSFMLRTAPETSSIADTSDRPSILSDFAPANAAIRESETDLASRIKMATPDTRAEILAAWLAAAPARTPAETWEIADRILGAPAENEENARTALLVESVGLVWLHRDPGAAVAFLAVKDPEFESVALQACVRLLSAKDPGGWLQGLAAGGLNDPALLGKCAAQAAVPVPVLRATADGLSKADRDRFLDAYVAGLSPSALLPATDAFTASELPSATAKILCRNLLIYGHRDIKGWLGGLESAEQGKLLDASCCGIMADAEGNERYLQLRLEIGPPDKDRLQAVFSNFGHHSSKVALELADRLPAELRAHALNHFAEGRLTKYLHEPAKLIQELDTFTGAEKDAMILRTSWFNEAGIAEPLLEFLKTVENPKVKRDAYGNLMAHRDLALASKRQVMEALLQENAERSDSVQNGLERIVFNGLEEDPQASGAWLQSLPAGTAKDYAIETMAQYWSYRDPTATWDWVQSLPTGAAKDRATEKVLAARADDAEFCVQTIDSISTPRIRYRAAERLVDRWKEVDPERIISLLKNSTLSADQIATLQTRATSKPKGG